MNRRSVGYGRSAPAQGVSTEIGAVHSAGGAAEMSRIGRK